MPAIGGVGTLRRSPARITRHVVVVRHLKNVLGCSSITSHIFHYGLLVVSLRFPHILTRVMHVVRLSNVAHVDRLARRVGQVGPLGVGSRLVGGRNFCRFGVGRFLLTLTLKVHPTGVCGKASSTIRKVLLVSKGKRILYCRGTRGGAFRSFLCLGAHLRGKSISGSGCNFLRQRGKMCCFGLGIGVKLIGE